MKPEISAVVEVEGQTLRVTGTSAEAIAHGLSAMAKSRALNQLKQMTWGSEDANRRMTQLCGLFPTLRDAPGTSPWNFEQLVRWTLSDPAVTSGSAQAARFVLGIWSGRTDGWVKWARENKVPGSKRASPFDAVHAFGIWDDAHREAALAWFRVPFWP